MEINERYTEFYSKRRYLNVYPTEFVVRSFLAEYPGLNMRKLQRGDKVIDIGCGDGRNTLFLMEQGYEVYGTEISQEIVDIAQKRLDILADNRGLDKAVLNVGRNSELPYENEFADAILACHVCYYCDEGQTIQDNLKEYYRVLKKDGYLIASVCHKDSFLVKGGDKEENGITIVKNDPYNNRNGYRIMSYGNVDEIEKDFQDFFYNFSFGQGHNNWYGIDENVYWCVCQKK